MTTFLRVLNELDKALALRQAIAGGSESMFEVNPNAFRRIPGAPFAYWVKDSVHTCFEEFEPFESKRRSALGGLKTLLDERFLRCWWEPEPKFTWRPIAKGGSFSPMYSDLHMVVNWEAEGLDISWYGYQRRPREGFGGGTRGVDAYFRPGITWPRRTNGLSFRIMPAGCIFADKGPAAFVNDDSPKELLALLSLLNSRAFGLLVSVQLARVELAQSFEVGLIQQTPIPNLKAAQIEQLAALGCRAWSLKRTLDTTTETSHAFLLPAGLRSRLGDYDPSAIEAELARIQAEIDSMAFDLYGFAEADSAAVQAINVANAEGEMEGAESDDDSDDEESAAPLDQTAGLLSWALGVAFGRFDWRLAIGELQSLPEPEPFDPLPTKSPGMLPDGAQPFHAHDGILVDDPGHPHDLA
ncbi:type II restriction endonuclease subunit M, partial [Pseudomonas frederiksbergensis]|uniref:BREX-1 system adenine-specific DNA-methyltransferase PglX n=1 Tax=Pseudomonas frederiksbergensis TaxID=104087 RepID=UPI001F11B4AA